MARRRHTRAKLSSAERNEVACRQQWRCNGTCGHVLPARYHIDHVVPLREGGKNEESNYQALCGNCHDAKTARECVAATKRRRAKAGVTSAPPPKRPRSWKAMVCAYMCEMDVPPPPSVADKDGGVDRTVTSVYFSQFKARPRTGGTGGRPGSSR